MDSPSDDKFIPTFEGVLDDDLVFCDSRGVAYQANRGAFDYGKDYFDHYADLSGSDLSDRLHHGRVAFVDHHLDPFRNVLDVGIGCGEFIKFRPNTYGYDVNPVGIKWLKNAQLWRDDFENFPAFTFWDVLEHVTNPDIYFSRMQTGSYLFTSLPIFKDLRKVRESKHYKPNEHYYYFTSKGFIDWMALHGFALLECSDYETKVGRESILSYAFIKRRSIV